MIGSSFNENYATNNSIGSHTKEKRNGYVRLRVRCVLSPRMLQWPEYPRERLLSDYGTRSRKVPMRSVSIDGFHRLLESGEPAATLRYGMLYLMGRGLCFRVAAGRYWNEYRTIDRSVHPREKIHPWKTRQKVTDVFFSRCVLTAFCWWNSSLINESVNGVSIMDFNGWSNPSWTSQSHSESHHSLTRVLTHRRCDTCQCVSLVDRRMIVACRR